MKTAVAILVAIGSLTVARSARLALTRELRDDEVVPPPFTPSPAAAPFVSLGYREAMADLVFVQLRAYFGNFHGTNAAAVASLGEAIVALDPRFRRAYELSANAMTIAPGADQPVFERAVALLEQGVAEFPQDWALPMLAGQIYIQDLKSDDPAQRRAWDERGTLLVESAIRKPGAPQESAIWAAHLRTKLGQHERAVDGIRELLLTSNNPRLRKALLDKLAALEASDAATLAAEVLGARIAFERSWRAERYSIPPSMYILLGARLRPGFDMADLATGGRDLIVNDPVGELEPLYE